MTDKSRLPFLFDFFESRIVGAPSTLGTETFTKSNESGDADVAPESARARRVTAVALGTETLTEVRAEGSDADERRPRGAVLGTQTATATQEQPDEDQPSMSRSGVLGTETFTRAQEGSDTDASRPGAELPLFAARVL